MGVKMSVCRVSRHKRLCLPTAARDRSEGQRQYTFSFQCALDADKQIFLAAIEEAKATGEVNVGYTPRKRRVSARKLRL